MSEAYPNRRSTAGEWFLLPWQKSTADTSAAPTPEMASTADQVVLYDHKGRALTRARPRLGFRPPTEDSNG